MTEGGLGAGEVIIKFIRLAFGGTAFGIACAIFVNHWLKRLYKEAILETNLTIMSCYLIFYVSESTELHVSGVLALSFFGLWMSKSGRTKFSSTSHEALKHIWSYLAYITETVIFLLGGIIIGSRVLNSSYISYKDYLFLLALYALLHVIRFIAISIFLPILRRLEYGLDWKSLVLLSFAGLRGALGICLALLIVDNEKIPDYTRDLILFHMCGIAFLTIIINGSTTGFLL